MIKASKNIGKNIVKIYTYLLITYTTCLFLADNIHLFGKKVELIDNRFVY